MAPSDRGPGLRRLRVIVIAALLLLLATAGGLAVFYTDLLWFRDLGQGAVFWTRFWSRLVTGLVFGAAGFALVYANLLVARHMASPVTLSVVGSSDFPLPPQMQVQQTLAQARKWAEPYLRWVVLSVALLIGWGSAASMAGNWELLRVAYSAVPFGQLDPQFGRDIAFFMFQLPALRRSPTGCSGCSSSHSWRPRARMSSTALSASASDSRASIRT